MSYYDIVFGPETCFFQNSVKCTTITSFDYIMVSTGSVDGGLTGSVPLEGNNDKENPFWTETEFLWNYKAVSFKTSIPCTTSLKSWGSVTTNSC
jgi:hypothetical protein